ncbi:hypothetical protein D9758_012178 [Tetrapyrgos nigripes]|uniref:Guanine nucleotide-binding protein alpha-4 subunit n=1 Tax=Tetrapyrgos nigripes TaxID=182062 RepID=A0A8H5CHX6_9AGAR|nr:hypothetical protein D9758_012178 [Tetrapyrgos nigripes]
MRTPSIYSQDDPLTEALKPSENETEEQRRVRLQQETEARLVSERIDEDLRQERERMRKSRGDVKLLLLGQAESGKSTLQKQFQLMYKPHSLDQERVSWRTVIYFNVIRSIKHILSTLESWDDYIEGVDAGPTKYVPAVSSPSPGPSSPMMSPRTPNGISSRSNSPFTSTAAGKSSVASLRRRLSPLVAADTQLADKLSGGVAVSGSGKGNVFVRTGWQARTIENALGRRRQRPSVDVEKTEENFHDPLIEEIARMLEASKDDIRELWAHPTVKGLIAKRRMKLDEWAEFFLRHIPRIASAGYIPTTDDILHARIQTMGVSEHVFDVTIHGKSVSWHLFDVGGARGQRHSWVPYFDDANAIIFVAPISAFDQYLEEDPRTNRIDDSLQLFTQICSNPLLKSVHLVLFLNKTDLLRAKLDSGLKVKKYITSFGDRVNDYETIVQYFRAHFLQVHRKNNENRRVLYTHFTSVVDTKATQRIIGNVRDSIFRGYLQSAALV